jgi:hypothetical protein
VCVGGQQTPTWPCFAPHPSPVSPRLSPRSRIGSPSTLLIRPPPSSSGCLVRLGRAGSVLDRTQCDARPRPQVLYFCLCRAGPGRAGPGRVRSNRAQTLSCRPRMRKRQSCRALGFSSSTRPVFAIEDIGMKHIGQIAILALKPFAQAFVPQNSIEKLPFHALDPRPALQATLCYVQSLLEEKISQAAVDKKDLFVSGSAYRSPFAIRLASL